MNIQDEIPTFGDIRNKGWTLRQVAKSLRRSPSHISRVLSRERKCTPELAQQLINLPFRDYNPGRGKDRNPLPRNLRRPATVA